MSGLFVVDRKFIENFFRFALLPRLSYIEAYEEAYFVADPEKFPSQERVMGWFSSLFIGTVYLSHYCYSSGV